MDDQRLDRIETKLDKHGEILTEIKTILSAQHETLKTHEQRSTNLEAIVLPMKAESDAIHGAVKFIKLCALIVGMLVGIGEMIHWFIR